ncbi:MAG: cache domain-containing protein, partial [Desulfobacterales bacterium]
MPKNAKKLNLTTLIVFGILAPSFLVAILLAAFWVGSEYLQFRTTSEEMETQYIIAQKSLIKLEVGRVIDYIKREKGKAEARLKADIKSRVYEAFAIAEG